MSVPAITIIVAPTGIRSRYCAWIGDRLLVKSSRTPLLDAARMLSGEGVDPATRIVMRHQGKDYDALRSTVGTAAGLVVEEHDAPRFRKWRPTFVGGLPRSDETETAATYPQPTLQEALL